MPRDGMKTGQILRLEVSVFTHRDDSVTLVSPRFSPLEIHRKSRRVERTPHSAVHTLSFGLLALAPGDVSIPSLELQIVTPSGTVKAVHTDRQSVRVHSWLANEPNAKLRGLDKKDATQPVSVWRDDFTLLWLGGALLVTLLLILLVIWLQGHLKTRRPFSPAHSPRRAAWEIAQEKLRELCGERDALFDRRRGIEFVDRLSDILREYLGNRYGFDGLESTTDEVLARMERLKPTRLPLGILNDTLFECDLIKFAKASVERHRAEELWGQVKRIVEATTPRLEPEQPNCETLPNA
ncbi:MAG: hypothetical protein H6714_11045 [Myxococcales bacterium]|nr:hypothetical protein [Myxococcales bacterium]